MALKFFGIDASGNKVALTRLAGGSIRILGDRVVVGKDIFLRNGGEEVWLHEDGKPPRFVEIAVEEEQAQPAPAPAPARETRPTPTPPKPPTR